MAASPSRDIWAAWLIERRFGGDEEFARQSLDFLARVRDRVLDNAALEPNDTLLDLGSGDGLIPFGALDRLGNDGTVIFSDLSRDLLAHARDIAGSAGILDRCRFVEMPADNLSPIDDASIDVVTTRSVLIYVDDKQEAFDEIHRVLRPGGRLSIFEPINSFGWPEPPDRFHGFDVSPVQEVADKVKAGYEAHFPSNNSMLNFAERDLVAFADTAGFSEVHMTLEVQISDPPPMKWDTYLHTAWNPRMPTLHEAMQQALTPAEIERFTTHLRPLVEHGPRRWTSAWAYLWAVK
jgi:arsenite methyltransferase